jgi:hypothetical protein
MTTLTHDLYGNRSNDMDELRRAVEAVLGIQFQSRWSDFFGGDYLNWRSDGSGRQHVRIIRNHHRNLSDYRPGEEVAEPDFADYSLLLTVEGCQCGDDLKLRLTTIPGLDFLRRK